MRLVLGSSISTCASTEATSHIPDLVSPCGIKQVCRTDILVHRFPNSPKELAIAVTLRLGSVARLRRPRRFLGRAVTLPGKGAHSHCFLASTLNTLGANPDHTSPGHCFPRNRGHRLASPLRSPCIVPITRDEIFPSLGGKCYFRPRCRPIPTAFLLYPMVGEVTFACRSRKSNLRVIFPSTMRTPPSIPAGLPASTSRLSSRTLSDNLCSVGYPRMTPRSFKTELRSRGSISRLEFPAGRTEPERTCRRRATDMAVLSQLEHTQIFVSSLNDGAHNHGN